MSVGWIYAAGFVIASLKIGFETSQFAILWYWLAVAAWGGLQEAEQLFNLSAMSIRQAIVPAQLLGRVQSVALVPGYSSIPLGVLGRTWIIRPSKKRSMYCTMDA